MENYFGRNQISKFFGFYLRNFGEPVGTFWIFRDIFLKIFKEFLEK